MTLPPVRICSCGTPLAKYAHKCIECKRKARIPLNQRANAKRIRNHVEERRTRAIHKILIARFDERLTLQLYQRQRLQESFYGWRQDRKHKQMRYNALDWALAQHVSRWHTRQVSATEHEELRQALIRD